MSKIFIVLSIVLIFGGCGRKTTPSIIYQDKLTTNYDTIMLYTDAGVDTIFSSTPCDSFVMVVRKTDTIYIRKIQKEVQTKLVVKRDTIYRTPIVSQTIKINNKGGQIGNDNISEKTKKGDNITGDGNTVTKPVKKGSSWFWIFVCGMLVMFLIQNVGFRVLKMYFPFLKFLP